MDSAEVLEERRSCVECPARRGFCNLPDYVLSDLGMSKREIYRDSGEILYRQGERCAGLFVLCRGRVKLSKMSNQGKTAILQICGSGDLLGASEVLANCAYAATAQVQEESVLAYVPRDTFLQMMARHSIVGLRTSEHLGAECLRAFRDLGFLRIPSSALQKLSRLLLRWCSLNEGEGVQEIPMIYTHAELAQLIGTSRETVTRLLNRLDGDAVISVRGGVGRVLDINKLRVLASAA
ncbi:MAG TPA: Crp/Fnr family transcriptional regulator [Terriglobales bacterium]|nr:Crp/Fnr family transcriptional regulator [Terriglobales bacterium]